MTAFSAKVLKFVEFTFRSIVLPCDMEQTNRGNFTLAYTNSWNKDVYTDPISLAVEVYLVDCGNMTQLEIRFTANLQLMLMNLICAILRRVC
jgi:hypothetical protein